MMNKNSITLILLLTVFFIILFYKGKDQPKKDTYLIELEQLKSEINYWDSLALIQTYKIDSLEHINIKLIITRDSIIKVNKRIKYKYNEIYKSIHNSSTDQLDSIIRANW